MTAELPFAEIQAIALDMDGVLTDGGFWWGPNGEEWKRFCFADVMGISLGRKSGLTFALISGEDSELVSRFAAKMEIETVFRGCKDKRTAVLKFAEHYNFSLTQVAFMGDDINDIPAMQVVGLAACPAYPVPAVAETVDFVSTKRGGDGAVRELIDTVLAAQKGSGSSTIGG